MSERGAWFAWNAHVGIYLMAITRDEVVSLAWWCFVTP